MFEIISIYELVKGLLAFVVFYGFIWGTKFAGAYHLPWRTTADANEAVSWRPLEVTIYSYGQAVQMLMRMCWGEETLSMTFPGWPRVWLVGYILIAVILLCVSQRLWFRVQLSKKLQRPASAWVLRLAVTSCMLALGLMLLSKSVFIFK